MVLRPASLDENFKFKCLFKIIDANDYLETFSSDRTRMMDNKGQFIKPPPNYPCIQTLSSKNNLNEFISMNKSQCNPKHKIYNLDQLKKLFTK